MAGCKNGWYGLSEKTTDNLYLCGVRKYIVFGLSIFGGFAVNAVMQGHVWQALTYALLVLVMWLIGAARRSVDTRTFGRIYSEIAVPVIVKQRLQGQSVIHFCSGCLVSGFVDFLKCICPRQLLLVSILVLA